MTNRRPRSPRRPRPYPQTSRPPRSARPSKPWLLRLLPWLVAGMVGVFVISMVPNFWPDLIPSLLSTDEAKTPPPLETMPLWQSSFEGEFPGKEWPPAQSATFSPTGQALPNADSQWAVITPTPKDAVKPVDGDRLYKGWINRAKSDGTPHFSYPGINLDNNPDYLQRVTQPIAMRFYVWADWDGMNAQSSDWLNLVEFGGKSGLRSISLGMRGSQNKLELFNVGAFGEFNKGNGWEVIAPTETVSLPLRQWVRFTVYVDYQQPLLVVWMNEVPIFRANGGNLRSSDGTVPYLLTAHWGLQGAGTLKTATVYNDHLQLWSLSGPMMDFAQEPKSPYEKSRMEQLMELPPDAPPEIRNALPPSPVPPFNFNPPAPPQ